MAIYVTGMPQCNKQDQLLYLLRNIDEKKQLFLAYLSVSAEMLVRFYLLIMTYKIICFTPDLSYMIGDVSSD